VIPTVFVVALLNLSSGIVTGVDSPFMTDFISERTVRMPGFVAMRVKAMRWVNSRLPLS